MSIRILSLTLACWLTCVAATGAEEGESKTSAIRAAIQKSLPFLEEKGVAWINERGCITCHQTTFLIWTHNDALRRGFAVDSKKLNDWNNYALLKALAGGDGSTPASPEAMGQLLLGRDVRSPLTAKPPRWMRTTDPYENLLARLMIDQNEEGHWKAGGQSHNPPDIPTGWALVAMASREQLLKTTPGEDNPGFGAGPGLIRIQKKNSEALVKSRDRALAWLKTEKENKAIDLTEQLVVRLLVEKHYGTPEKFQEQIGDLLARQNADGGWSADPKRRQPSDAFATGQSLYALSQAGTGGAKADAAKEQTAKERAAIERAIKFLTRTQKATGDWHVPTTAFMPSSGNPDRERRTDDIYIFWGTAWATIGLLRQLPLADAVAKKPGDVKQGNAVPTGK